MKEQDLLESFSGISEELLKRSENNKKTGSNETKAAEKSNAKAGSSWRKLGYIAAVLVLTAGLIILFIHISNKTDSDVSNIGGESTNINNGSEQGIVDIEPLAISEGRKLAEKIQNQLPEDVWGGYYSVSNWIYYNPEELNNFTVYIRIVKDYDNLPVYDNVVYERVRYSWDELNSYRKKLNEHKEEFGFTNAVIIKNNKIEVTSTGLSMTLRQKSPTKVHDML